MKRRLCIGVHHLGADWTSMLDQIGVSFEEIDYSTGLMEFYSVLIVNGPVSSEEESKLWEFMQNGGSVLEMTGCTVFHNNKQIQFRTVNSLINNSEHPAFRHIPFIDLYDTVQVIRDSRLFEGLVHLSRKGKGSLAFLGADLPALLQDLHYTRKRLYTTAGPYPDELLSRISKYEAIELTTALLKELHIQQELPFIQKWTSPTHRTVFCFRIDSDFGRKENILNLYALFREYEIPATWFLHVEAHETWLDTFTDFEAQELALHGYAHGTSNSSNKIRDNILKGYKMLEKAGILPVGYAAPYGIYTETLGDILMELSIRYCSEFTFGHDSTPIDPSMHNAPLQIPIHPICTGSLARKKYNPEQMLSYFKEVVDKKQTRSEPVLFYHHPMQNGSEVWQELFQQMDWKKYDKMSFKSYAHFWSRRQECTFEAYFVNNTVEWVGITDPELYLLSSISHENSKLGTLKMHSTDNVHSLSFKTPSDYLPSDEPFKKLKVKNWSLTKSSILDWKNRKRL